MASPILTVVANVMQALAVAWPTVAHAFGRRALAQLEAAEPFIVWAPSQAGDRFGPPDAAFLESEQAEAPAQPLLTIITRLEAHCRGGSFELTEALRHDLASVIQQQLAGSFDLPGGGWVDNANAFSSRSEVYVLLVDLKQPIVDRLYGEAAPGRADIETVAVGSEMLLPGSDVEPDVVLPLPPEDNPMPPEPQAPPAPAEERDVEAWASAKNTPAIWLRAAKVMHHWCLGQQVTENAFDAAIHAAQHGA